MRPHQRTGRDAAISWRAGVPLMVFMLLGAGAALVEALGAVEGLLVLVTTVAVAATAWGCRRWAVNRERPCPITLARLARQEEVRRVAEWDRRYCAEQARQAKPERLRQK
jgi:hypothetical protein